jgi:hypothetical protein
MSGEDYLDYAVRALARTLPVTPAQQRFLGQLLSLERETSFVEGAEIMQLSNRSMGSELLIPMNKPLDGITARVYCSKAWYELSHEASKAQLAEALHKRGIAPARIISYSNHSFAVENDLDVDSIIGGLPGRAMSYDRMQERIASQRANT